MTGMSTRIFMDGAVTGGTVTGGTTGIFFRFTKTPPTVCGYPERRGTGYYCIRATGHPALHRYGTVIEGSFTARKPQT